jgi:CheY-like chemotaxis protein
MQGQLGLDLARQHRPDLIVLDLHLPDMTGEEVLRRLKADPSTREIPVVVLSADASNGQVDRLMREGADDYMTKPLDVTRFLGVLADKLGDNGAH